MNPIAYIDRYASSDTDNGQIDRMFLDLGEHQTIAMIEIKLPPEAGSVPHKQFAHSVILKLLNDDARSRGLVEGTVELRDGRTEAELKAELRKSSTADDSVYEHPRAQWAKRQRDV
jgi:hypothetical protein